jgi:hypothetical protein
MGRSAMGVRLAVCSRGLPGRLGLLIFSGVLSGLGAALCDVLLAVAGGIGGAARWSLMVAIFFLLMLLNLSYHFGVYPDVELYDGGLLVKLPGRRVFVPWAAVERVQEGPQRARVIVRARLAAVNRLLGLALRQPHAAFLLARQHGGYVHARRIMRDRLQRDGRFVASSAGGKAAR